MVGVTTVIKPGRRRSDGQIASILLDSGVADRPPDRMFVDARRVPDENRLSTQVLTAEVGVP
jgi:hypothetical protein